MTEAKPAAAPDPLKRKYVDALRGLAILGVIMVHCGQNGNNQHLTTFVKYVILNGSSGVALFYFVSAYTLIHSTHARAKVQHEPLSNFYLRRFFRIAPMFYVAIIYYLWQDTGGHLGNSLQAYTAGNIISHFTLLHGFHYWWMNTLVPGGWSVANEVLFYALLPLLFRLVNSTQKAACFFLITLYLRYLLDFALRKYVVGHDDILLEYTRLYLPAQMPVFALGILYYFVINDGYKLKVSPVVIFAMAITLLMNILGVVILPVNVLCTIAFFVLAIALSKKEFRFIVNPVIVYLGKVSYSVYLCHFAVLYWLGKYNLVDYFVATSLPGALANFALRYLVVALLAVAISSITYKLIEVPMQRLGHRIIKNRKKASAELL